MSTNTPPMAAPGLADGDAKVASQHTRPDKRKASVRTDRCEVRLNLAERRELERRCPPGLDLSSWLRGLGLGQPTPERRGSRRRRSVSRPAGSKAEQQQARALMSLAQSLGGLVDRMRPGTQRDQVAALIEYVRRKWEGLRHADRDV